MSIKKLLLLIGLSMWMVGCSTTNSTDLPTGQKESATQLGVRYLLGRGVPQDQAKAFAYFKEAADDNDPFAQNEVAYLYAAGKGTTQNYTQAFKYYQKAANQGLASAQYNLGLFYAKGLGVPQNQTLAKQWFEKSASHGFEPAKQALTQ